MDLDILLHKFSFQFTRNIFLSAWRSITIFTRVCWESKISTVILRSVKIMLEDLILSSSDLSEIHDCVSLIIFENFTDSVRPSPTGNSRVPRFISIVLLTWRKTTSYTEKQEWTKMWQQRKDYFLQLIIEEESEKQTKLRKSWSRRVQRRRKKSSPFIQNYVESLKEDTHLQTKSAVISAWVWMQQVTELNKLLNAEGKHILLRRIREKVTSMSRYCSTISLNAKVWVHAFTETIQITTS